MKSSNEITGTVFNIQRYSIEDGPGIRTTVFLKGCPLRCLWCSNPESQKSEPELAHQDLICTGCGDCLEVCGENAISIVPDGEKFSIKLDRDKCVKCGHCVDICYIGALKFYGQTMTVDEVYNVVMKDESYYARSDGGVTIGGGEPLMQADFITALLKKLQDAGIHTAVDTCGFYPTSELEKVLPFIDLFLFDIKVMDTEMHKQYTGQNNDIILHNLKLIVEKGVPVNIRIPLIPGKNDSEDNLNAIAGFVAGLDKNLHVDLLPYHRFGMGKYEMLDMQYKLKDTEYLSEKQLEDAVAIFERYGLECEIQ